MREPDFPRLEGSRSSRLSAAGFGLSDASCVTSTPSTNCMPQLSLTRCHSYLKRRSRLRSERTARALFAPLMTASRSRSQVGSTDHEIWAELSFSISAIEPASFRYRSTRSGLRPQRSRKLLALARSAS